MSIKCTYSSYEFNPHQQQLLEKEEEEEEYIDMEITSFYTAFLHHHHHQSKDFEFSLHHSSRPSRATSHSRHLPADELFSNGKLLPLHPRPYNPNPDPSYDPNYDPSSFSTPLATTPFESCNVSPAESCNVSRELTPVDYNLSNAQEATTNHTKRSNWAKKLKLIKRPSLLSSKIKASKSYFKSLFGAKSNSPDHNPGDEDEEKTVISHRKSFSGAFRPIKAKTVSSESSSSSALKRSNSSRTSENESSVEGAIAHCKQSQSHRALRSWKNFGAIRFEACQE